MVEDSEETNPDLQEYKVAASAVAEESRKSPLNIPFWAKLLITAVLVFLSSIGYIRTLHTHENAQNDQDIQGATSSDLPSVEKRKEVPNIKLMSSSGPAGTLDKFKGKVVLLSFWASWCTPCLVELPTFIDLYEKLSKKGLEIVPINVDETDTATQFVPDFWKTKKFPFTTYYDPDHKSADEFHVDSLPSNFVLDKKGRLVATGYGANDWASDASVKFIEQLLSE